ncbi:MAG: hypothetical protein HQL06_05145 [Nitrospirae bacterium]|nr:hypothetical protein [Nitrospirota bacterium]
MKIKETITLIYFRDKSGKARTFKMARSVFVFLVSFMLLLLLSAVPFVYFGFKHRLINNDLSLKIIKLEKENTSVKESLKALEIKKLAFLTTPPVRDSGSVKVDDFDYKTVNTGQVDADNLEITNFEERKILIISFDISKTRMTDAKMTGYVFIIWKTDGKYSVVPQSTEVKNGVPVKYTSGEGFDIKIKKHFTKTLSATLNKIQLLYLLVYDENGTIILKKNVDLKL